MAYNLNTADYRLPAKYVNKERALPVGSLIFSDGSTQSTAGGGASGTWSPVYSNQTGWTGTPVTAAGTPKYWQTGSSLVHCRGRISGLSTPGSAQNCQLRLTLPVARTAGNFTDSAEGTGMAMMGSATANADVGFAFSIVGTQTMVLEIRNSASTSTAVDIEYHFTYELA